LNGCSTHETRQTCISVRLTLLLLTDFNAEWETMTISWPSCQQLHTTINRGNRKPMCTAVMSYSSLSVPAWQALTGDHTTCHPYIYQQVEWTIPAFNPQLQSITAL